jgi:hypothetical protein
MSQEQFPITTQAGVQAALLPQPASMSIERRQITDYLAYGTIVLSLVLLAYGTATRDRDRFVPYEGVGYYLGIAGGTLILFQMIYSLLKRHGVLGSVGIASTYFHLHMLVGVTGPMLILYHCNFSLGAKNSNVALAALALVVFSGFFGRIACAKIHARLLHAIALAEARLLMTEQATTNYLAAHPVQQQQVSETLSRFCITSLAQSRGSLLVALGVPFRCRLALLRLDYLFSRFVWAGRSRFSVSWAEVASARAHIRHFLRAYRKASQLKFWDRLFSAWHIFHLPLVFLLFIAGVTHVVAVHWY